MKELNSVEGRVFAVTGGCGFVGRRVCEFLVEQGAKHVRSFDICPPTRYCNPESDQLTYHTGDITNQDDVDKVIAGVDCVFHIAALVGPYHAHEMYVKVNYHGTLNVIGACKKFGVTRCVMSSSPSTRFDGSDMLNKRAEEMPIRSPGEFLQAYAETKAMGELAMRAANDNSTFLTVCIAPHQVYGPRDSLFLPNIINACRSGKLRVFGSGNNKVSFTHVDNYSHALLLGYKHLYIDSPVLGNFYLSTDGEPQLIWQRLNECSLHLGYADITAKWRVPYYLMMGIAYIAAFLGYICNKKFKLNPFTAKMLMIHRSFNIESIERDLIYVPLIKFEDGWKQTLDWFAQEQNRGKKNA